MKVRKDGINIYILAMTSFPTSFFKSSPKIEAGVYTFPPGEMPTAVPYALGAYNCGAFEDGPEYAPCHLGNCDLKMSRAIPEDFNYLSSSSTADVGYTKDRYPRPLPETSGDGVKACYGSSTFEVTSTDYDLNPLAFAHYPVVLPKGNSLISTFYAKGDRSGSFPAPEG